MQATISSRFLLGLTGVEKSGSRFCESELDEEFSSLLIDISAETAKQDSRDVEADINGAEQGTTTVSVEAPSSDMMPVLLPLDLFTLIPVAEKTNFAIATEKLAGDETRVRSSPMAGIGLLPDKADLVTGVAAEGTAHRTENKTDDPDRSAYGLKNDITRTGGSVENEPENITAPEFAIRDHHTERAKEAARQEVGPSSSAGEPKSALSSPAMPPLSTLTLNSSAVPPSPMQQLLSRVEAAVQAQGGQSTPAAVQILPDPRMFSKPGDLRILRMTLMPEELGHVDVTLRRTVSGFRVHISVSTETAARALQADLGLLKDRLGDLIVGLPSAAVDIGLREQLSTGPRDVSQQLLSQEGPGSFGGASAGMGRRPSPDRNEIPVQASRDKDDENGASAGILSVGIVV